MASETNIDAAHEELREEITTCIRGIPKDVWDELGRRAEKNFRPRNGEVVAVLTAVCRGRIELPISLYDGAAQIVPVPPAASPAAPIQES